MLEREPDWTGCSSVLALIGVWIVGLLATRAYAYLVAAPVTN